MTNQTLVKTEQKHREIRSFVLRAGRMTSGQKKAIEIYWPMMGLKVENGLLNYTQTFPQQAPVVFEIGFGMGDSLIELAKTNSTKNYIGVEVHPPGVGKLLQVAADEKLSNLKIYAEDAVDVLNQCLPDESLSAVLLFFPDPWPKKKHHKRRIVQPEFVQLVKRKLAVGGVFHMATDWQPYAEHMLEVMDIAEGYENCAGASNYMPRPESRPVTKFEKRGERLGHGVWDIIFKRVN